MRFAFVGLFLVACTKPNPEVCCATEEQCAQLGVSDIRPCDVGQACSSDFACVAAECTTSADCSSPALPVCSLGLCVANCRVDDDCADVAGRPVCASDGVCVGCETADQCPAEAAFCDADDRTCRGCEKDDECSSGVCIEADARCADAQEVIYVSSAALTDTGTCTESAPCKTLGFAAGLVTPTRAVIHLLGGQISQGSTVTFASQTVIDGTGTRIVTPASGPLVDLPTNGGAVTIEGIQITNTTAKAEATVASSRTLRLFDVSFEKAPITNNGTLDVARSTIRASRFSCTSGTITVRQTELAQAGAGIFSMNCQANVESNRFLDVQDGSIDATGGALTVTNNLFTVPSEFADLIRVNALSPGSIIAFNTIVNTSSVTMSPVAITCDSTVKVSSNIFAYNSTNPLSGSGCVAVSSLFDLAGAPDAAGNVSADPASFFVDRSGGDFHLSGGSPARGIGEAGIVTLDLEGVARPSSMPDVGALEAP